MTSANPTNPGANALIKQIKDLLEIQEANLTAKFATGNHEIKVQMDALRQEVVTLQQISAGSKKTPAKAAAKTAETVTTDAATPEVAKKPFATNIPAYFTQLYKEESDAGKAFREKYLNKDMLDALAADATINAKKDGEVKTNAKARFCHTWLKTNNKALADQFATEYKSAKEQYTAASKPQQTAEPTTPENTD